MKAFRVEGLYSPKGKEWYKFSKELIAESEDEAIERAYSLLGSKYGIKRRLIDIKGVKEISAGEVTDPVVKYHLKRGKE